ncbi:hypothetical protein BDV96DRAFT_658883 [Lophiotrema nucula]|uniref:NACHT domain-containing protein n=1 Tax=Lophiotrema nucula TaxID=690887 RepID=A0A6A5Z8K8_9PLEO|nr:hypothetical protein BDV96DRAFT_658883 [Lophiotrema nucula]
MLSTSASCSFDRSALTRLSVDKVSCAFEEAYQAFVVNLTSEEKAKLLTVDSIEDLISSVEKTFQHHSMHRSRYKACAQKIQQFGQRFAPFFKVISIFVQTNPKYAGLVWGSLRMIYQLGEQYIAFLERLCESFRCISGKLPGYATAARVLQAVKNQQGGRLDYRLLRSLVSIYKDIIAYCYQAYGFLTNQTGFRKRALLVWRISSSSFEAHFGKILDDAQRHADLFESEIALCQLELGVLQLGIGERQRDRLEELYYQFEQEQTRQRESTIAKRDDWAQKEREYWYARRLKLRTWINAPDWEEAHRVAVSRMKSQSTDWFFFQQIYRDWRRLVDTLNNQLEHLLPADDNQTAASVHYFYFDKTRPSLRDNMAAFRAILAQVLHAHSDDREALDFACFMMYDGLSGQQTGCRDEIVTLLNWFLRRYPRTVLVIDGLDESNDPKDFLDCLQKSSSTSKFSKFSDDTSTPSCSGPVNDTEPSVSQHQPRSGLPCATASASPNFEAIECYLRDVLERLNYYGMLGADVDILSLARLAATHSDSMFLWARLLAAYLETEGLSVQDRLNALSNLVYIRGLDNLFDSIISRLDRILPDQVKFKVQNAFHWVIGAKRSLTVEQLNDAVALPVVSTLQSSRIPNLRETLPRISCGMLEITPQGYVVFLHSSVKEYIEKHQAMSRQAPRPGVSVIAAPEKNYIFRCCISYLTDCLSLESKTRCQFTEVIIEEVSLRHLLPLLDYVLRYWISHLSSTVSSLLYENKGTMPAASQPDLSAILHIVTLIRDFILDKSAVMSWIEASWWYGKTPSIDQLTRNDANLSFSPHDVYVINPFTLLDQFGVTSREVDELRSNLLDLQSDLHSLNREWSHILAKVPNQIWQPSVLAFCKSRFWYETMDASVETVTTTELLEQRTISIESRVSSGGRELGLLSLIAPRSSWITICPTCSETRQSRDRTSNVPWKVSFEVWDIATHQAESKFKIIMDIKHSDIRAFFTFCPKSHPIRVTEIRVPIAISSDLRKIIVKHDLAVIRETTRSIEHPNARGCSFDILNINSLPVESQRDPAAPNPLRGVLFDGCGNYLLFASDRGSAVFKIQQRLELVAISPETFLLDDLSYEMKKVACFHPSMPILAYSTSRELVLWGFANSFQDRVAVFNHPVADVKFSNCGNFISAYDPLSITKDAKLFNVTSVISMLSSSRSVLTISQSGVTTARDPMSVAGCTASLFNSDWTLGNTAPPKVQVQYPNAIAFQPNEGQGLASMSMLQQFREDGEIVLTTLREDGSVSTESLTRLPRSLKLSHAVLVSKASEDTIRIVLNVKRQDRYAPSMASQTQPVPMVIERTRSSIQSVQSRGQGAIGTGNIPMLSILQKRTRNTNEEWTDAAENNSRKRLQSGDPVSGYQ